MFNYLGFPLQNRVFLAPMAGITDQPFRQICKKLGAGLAVSEMITSNSIPYENPKTKRRLSHEGESSPIVIQLVGADPKLMSEAARYSVDCGAQIIDINMGCPSKKVCHTFAGAALMQNPTLATRILESVVRAVPNTPVTLKMRTGWDHQNRNAPALARIAEDVGIRAITIHGRTRADGFSGKAEYDTIAYVKSLISIPVIANGDIDTPEKARFVLDYTRADAIMIGRAAWGKPWIFREVDHYLTTGEKLPPPSLKEIRFYILQHLENIYSFYGEKIGVKIARKHIGWYSKGFPESTAFRRKVNELSTMEAQRLLIETFFDDKAC